MAYRIFIVVAFLSLTVYVAVVHVKDWNKSGKEEKGRFRKFLSIFIPSYEAQKKLLVGIFIVMVLIGGGNALVYFQDHNKWENFKNMLERDRVVKTQHVYGEKSGVDLNDYDRRTNKLFPDLYNKEVVRFKKVGGRIEPFRSARMSEDDIRVGPGDRVHVSWEVLDKDICDTPVRAYCGIGGGAVSRIGIVDKNDSIRVPSVGVFVMRAFCYVKDDSMDYYTLVTPKIDLTETTASIY